MIISSSSYLNLHFIPLHFSCTFLVRFIDFLFSTDYKVVNSVYLAYTYSLKLLL